MKHLILICSIFFWTQLLAQNSEFTVYPNGLIYNDSTMHQLTTIADSLQVKFMQCDITLKHRSKKQAVAALVKLEIDTEIAAKIKTRFDGSIAKFKQEYSKCTIIDSVAIVTFAYINHEKQPVIEFDAFQHRIDITTPKDQNFKYPQKHQWLFKYIKNYDNQSIATLYGFYFISDFESMPIPDKYNEMIQYADCLIDTTTTKQIKSDTNLNAFKENNDALNNWFVYEKNHSSRPVYPNNNTDSAYSAYNKAYEIWASKRWEIMDSLQQADSQFNALLGQAVVAGIAKNESNKSLEEYAQRYISANAALELKRRREVYGFCSMDNRPRIHAMEIAILSAEAVNWSVFLRAHLDIMNDNFSRASDGSYAWGQRETYLKELEVLNVNTFDLLIGITLRMEKPAQNHYYSSIRRIGRALAEANNQEEVKKGLISMITNKSLDHYNRYLLFYTYAHYCVNQTDERTKKKLLNKLPQLRNSFSRYMQKELTWN